MLCACRKKYGIEHVLIKVIDSWTCALDEYKFMGTVLMDLFKAFDYVCMYFIQQQSTKYDIKEVHC